MSQAVIVVGGGPTGLMLTAELGIAGVPAILLEREPEPRWWSQAFAIHTSTYEMFKQRDLDRYPDAPRFQNYNYGFPGIVAMDESNIPRIVPQRLVEGLLSDRLADHPSVEVRRGHELLDLAQDADGVTATVRGPEGEYTLRAPYLVGCDGGRSKVRKIAGIGFPGTDATLCGRTGDMEILNEEYRDGIAPKVLPKGLCAVIKHPDEPGLFRGTVIEYDSERPSEDVPMTGEEFREAFLKVTGIDLKIGRTGWLTRFGDAVRHASDYRAERVFIAGDAAHLHFPSAGQGLNTGMQDAMNLGWKLAGVMNGHVSSEILDTYHRERHPVGFETCVYPQAQVALMHPFERSAPLRQLFGELMQFEDVSHYLVQRSSGLGIRYAMEYPDDVAVDHPLLGLRITDLPLVTDDGETSTARLLHAGRGVVLNTTGDPKATAGLSGWEDRVDTVVAQPVEAIDAAVLLIRPDGHIAFVDPDGEHTGGLTAALNTWFGAPSVVPTPA
ncbi:FAD-dependent monooxygenase [Nocardiopsis deserti]|uniref:FAD-dependent monooxygenase n=1 Tax=Nocardiopsis deserti TaxID=2605988 RepID=UPI0012398AC1|nr:FAD-dependent monooxygenase [Nocardiopsis deserti]